MNKRGERRPISPVGEGPDRERKFWQLCCSYLDSLSLDSALFDPALDKRYTQAPPSRSRVSLTTATGSIYEVPIGWIGQRVPAWCDRDEQAIWSRWHTPFYPCPPEHVATILRRLRTGGPVIPGDSLPDGTRCKAVRLAQPGLVERAQPNTPRRDRCATRVYTTPSARYAPPSSSPSPAARASSSRGAGSASRSSASRWAAA